MGRNNNSDKYFRELLSDSSREMPFGDFEDDLMTEIHMEHEKRSSFLKNIKISWIFFFLGMLSGIAVVVFSMISADEESVSGVIDNYSLLIIIPLCLCILLFAEKLVKSSIIRNNPS